MKIKSVEIGNFRLLKKATIALDDDITLIVGRNNSGKTSLIDLFNKFLSSDKTKFKFEDFSIKTHKEFSEAVKLWKELFDLKKESSEEDIKKKDAEFRLKVPSITLTLMIEYEESDKLASLAPFIMDLDPDRKDACIQFVYSPDNTEKMLKELSKEDNCVDFLKKNYQRFYGDKIFTLDNETGRKKLIDKKSIIFDLILSSFIYAQRYIDDQALESSRKLSKSFEEYYNSHHKDKEISEELQNLLDDTSLKWDDKYKEIFSILLNDLKTFGYPGLNSHNLAVKSQFDVEKVLKGNTNVVYEHSEDNFLPEAYNGLGFKNLIFIILQFISYVEKYKAKVPGPYFHLLFIEEPEVHLHPQMQCIFIRNIKDFIKSKTGWNVQVVITTHSSHIISESDFETIRYFDSSNEYIEVKNLQSFKPADAETIPFLKQYMTLKKCDLFFADKIIMVEGTVERLLLPLMIKKADEKNSTTLNAQYITLVEAGGAYAHKFKELLQFIGVKTLVITDLDSIDTSNDRKAAPVKDGDETSNAALKSWLPGKTLIAELLACDEASKIQGQIRVAYQVPESTGTQCGRSFEEAFILKNAKVLNENKKISNAKLFKGKSLEDIKDNSYELAIGIDKKTDFAFDIMLLDKWNIPKYIEEGLEWLGKEDSGDE